MNAEQTLATRARLHAALSVPARLAIVDALTLGDASPGDLGRRLGLPTNLLAHHLNALEETGLLVRTRSEGDHRRVYLRLVPAVLDLLTWPALPRPRRVAFVCTHNSARSQLAAAMWPLRSRIPVTSAGTQPAERVHPRAARTARRHGLTLRGARPTHVTDVLEPDDLVITVCDNANEDLLASDELEQDPPAAAGRRLHWSVPDPAMVDTDDAFEAAYTDLVHRIDRLAPTLDPRQASSGADHDQP